MGSSALLEDCEPGHHPPATFLAPRGPHRLPLALLGLFFRGRGGRGRQSFLFPLRFPLPSPHSPFPGRPPCTLLLGPLGQPPRACLQGRGAAGGRNVCEIRRPRRLGCPCQGPPLQKPFSVPQSGGPLPLWGPSCLRGLPSLPREGLLAWPQPSLFSSINKYFTQTPFLSPAFINLLVCVCQTQRFLGSGLK